VTGKGKPAQTHYKVIDDFGFASLIECKLKTGRTHQIRVHLAHIKHPVVGDQVYGSGRSSRNGQEFAMNFPRQALHAVALQFIHPRTGKVKKFISKLPRDMKKLLAELA
jgi:23S rRNA pseudouridine1911/1915/1917 synthase